MAIERSMVFNALDRAIENGYDEMKEWTPLTVAIDLCDLDTDFANVDPIDLVPHVAAWQKQ